MVERGCPILLKIKLLIFKVFSNTWHDRASQQVQVDWTSHSSIKKEWSMEVLSLHFNCVFILPVAF